MLLKRPQYRRFDPPVRYFDPDKDKPKDKKVRFSRAYRRTKSYSMIKNMLLVAGVIYAIFYLSTRF
ncbi:MAG: hypothetical protein L6Q77_11805 [Bacteroidetes bacterium]|nr:hypothetical protein [Bacteroidota bacterium]